ncbi:MAG: DUF4352 domain-containing protein [Mycobacteriaceae bacterium]|nr:DUF4352 domain-containing protein [Mycobacteriaceae bacterium]
MGAPSPVPGWYPDPGGQGQRYWNGTEWTQHQAPAVKKSSTGKTLAIVFGSIFAVFVVFGLAAVGSEKEDTPSRTPSASNTPWSPEAADTGQASAGINQPVRDGKFEFVVNGISTQRGFVVVQMQVTNIGNEAQTFFPQNQKLIDSAGREFECDTMAVYEFNDDGITELNPGLSTAILVPFQAPPNTAFSAVEVHDSAFSGGARVTLG